jgi:epoxyqueuosine reductase
MSQIVSEIEQAAQVLGFDVVGITNVARLDQALVALEDWRQAGFAAGMDYMKRQTTLHGSPAELVPYAASLISLAVNYYAPSPRFEHENRYGRIARYAWGRDYHEVVRPRLAQLAGEINQIASHGSDSANDFKARHFVDAVPLLERAVANRAGLGFFGKNTNLIRPTGGSWFFLAEIFVNVELPEDDVRSRVSCGTCHRCLDACPTGAFAGPYRLDSRRCISYLTIENKGMIPMELRPGLGEWIFGCDVCQDVCPFNRFSCETQWPELLPEAGPGPKLDLIELLSIARDSDYRARFAGTSLLRPKRRGMLRNAAVVAANLGCEAAIPALVELIGNDPEPIIRAHALWALNQLDRPKSGAMLERALATDPDPAVRAEARLLLEN